MLHLSWCQTYMSSGGNLDAVIYQASVVIGCHPSGRLARGGTGSILAARLPPCCTSCNAATNLSVASEMRELACPLPSPPCLGSQVKEWVYSHAKVGVPPPGRPWLDKPRMRQAKPSATKLAQGRAPPAGEAEGASAGEVEQAGPEQQAEQMGPEEQAEHAAEEDEEQRQDAQQDQVGWVAGRAAPDLCGTTAAGLDASENAKYTLAVCTCQPLALSPRALPHRSGPPRRRPWRRRLRQPRTWQ